MNSEIKLEYYDILNNIKMEHFKTKEPFNISNKVKITYDEVKLNYIPNKNYYKLESDNNKKYGKGISNVFIFT